MSTKRCRALFCSLAMLIGLASLAGAESPSLADRLAGLLKKELPTYQVVVVDPLTVKVGPGNELRYQFNLDQIESACETNPSDCDALLSDFAERFAEHVDLSSLPATAESLRVAVRPVDYLKQAEPLAGRLVSGPLAEGLVLICFYDRRITMQPATVSSVARLGLSAEQAIASCKANVRTILPLSKQVKDLPAHTLGALTGDNSGENSYVSSLFALHEDWAPIAARMHGRLIVAVPADDMVLYGEEEDRQAIESMSLYARQVAREASRPLSTKVFRWRSEGWEVASP